MKKMKIDGKEGRFLVEGIDYGDYLEGFFLNERMKVFAIETPNGPINGLWRPFRIVTGPNRMLEDVMLCCLNIYSQRHIYAKSDNEMTSIRLVKQRFETYTYYTAECGPPVVSENANAA